jgi:hypothetical protein
MGSTSRAVQVATPGALRGVERPISKPAAGQVRAYASKHAAFVIRI